ncbi:hypothetical protein GCM10011410_26880 [Hoyosella rhizosphaerae]|uniref:Uncharacterized protein n=1 Tax=Hoyosella rhizosphaerae TaxID=1755582 RepID=A0A916UHT4_9ACTN|nr:hypothetical protein GCM10011410_26880 [Hoyosella rhizosphaerae]
MRLARRVTSLQGFPVEKLTDTDTNELGRRQYPGTALVRCKRQEIVLLVA